ncbi:unnamed protein product, partial [Staurois parvus]
MKIEGEDEEDNTFLRDPEHVMENPEMKVTFKEEEIIAEISTEERYVRRTSEGCLISSPTCDAEDEITTHENSGKSTFTSNVGLYDIDRSPDPPKPEEPSSDRSHTVSPDPGLLNPSMPPDPSNSEGCSPEGPCINNPDTHAGLHSAGR